MVALELKLIKGKPDSFQPVLTLGYKSQALSLSKFYFIITCVCVYICVFMCVSVCMYVFVYVSSVCE